MPTNVSLGAVIRIAAMLLMLLAAPATAAEKLRVGKAVPEAFSFVPLDIGMRKKVSLRRTASRSN